MFSPFLIVEATGFEPATSASRTNIAMCYMVFFYFRRCYKVMFISLNRVYQNIPFYKENVGKTDEIQENVRDYQGDGK